MATGTTERGTVSGIEIDNSKANTVQYYPTAAFYNTWLVVKKKSLLKRLLGALRKIRTTRKSSHLS